MRPPVSITIGQLELHGFPVGRQHAIAQVFAAELRGLIERGGLASVAHESLEPAPICVDPAGPPRAIGLALARAIYFGGLGG